MKVYECGADTRDGKPAPTRRKPGAKDVFIQNLRGALDHRFSLVCDACLEGSQGSMPLILLGPTGVWVVLPLDEKGVYRITEDLWEELQSKKGGFKPVQLNPMATVIGKTQELIDYLTSRGIKVPSIEPVVFFSDPGAHIDSTRPSARIVPVDALQRFIITVWRSPVVFDEEEIQFIVGDLVCKRDEEPVGPVEETTDIYSMRELPPPKKPSEPSRLATMTRNEPEVIRRIARHFPFTRQQWILLAILLVVNIIVLVWLVVVLVIMR